MEQQLTIFDSEAAIRRDDGITRAVVHADRKITGWSRWAFMYLHYFVSTHREPFLVEDVRRYAENKGLKDPPSKRAWGAIVRAAQKAGLIESCGYRQTKNPKAHCTPATLWRSIT